MDIRDLRGLVDAYQNVYVDEEVEQLDEMGSTRGNLPGGQDSKAAAEARMRANVQRAQAPVITTGRGSSGSYQRVAADKGAGGDAAYRAGGGNAAARSGLTRQQIQQKGMAATRAAAKSPTPTKPAAPAAKPSAPAKPAATTPAAKPAAKPSAAPAAKPAASGGTRPAALSSASKVEPAKPAEKPSAMDAWAKANPKLAKAQEIRKAGGSRAEVNKALYDKGTAAAEKTPTVVKASYDMLSSSNIKGMIEAYAEVYAPQELDEKTAMSKRGYDEAPIRQKIAKSTGGGKAADRATELEKKSTFGDTKKAKQRTDYARKQRGDFRKTTSSSPGLHGYAHKSDDAGVKAKQAARGAQRGALTPAEKKQLNREELEAKGLFTSQEIERILEIMED